MSLLFVHPIKGLGYVRWYDNVSRQGERVATNNTLFVVFR
jgi:hypothetical protein